jgi:hypothetical protein
VRINYKYTIFVLFIIALLSCNHSENLYQDQVTEFNEIDTVSYAAIIRSDFSNEVIWKKVCDEIKKPAKKYGPVAYVQRISNKKYDRITKEKLLANLPSNYLETFVFVFDSVSVNNQEHPLLCVELFEKKYRSFYIKPSDLWIAENNLSIANMDFEEFLESVDSSNIFKGF